MHRKRFGFRPHHYLNKIRWLKRVSGGRVSHNGNCFIWTFISSIEINWLLNREPLKRFTHKLWQSSQQHSSENWDLVKPVFLENLIGGSTHSRKEGGAQYEIGSKLIIRTTERRQWLRSSVFIVNFEHI